MSETRSIRGGVVGQGADVRQVACRKHILQTGGDVITAVRHDLNIHFRVNTVNLLDKGFYLHIRCHKGNGFVHIVFFSRFGLTAAGSHRRRGCRNAADLQKKSGGRSFSSYKYTFLTLSESAVAQCCPSYSYTSHRNPHTRDLSAWALRRASIK